MLICFRFRRKTYTSCFSNSPSRVGRSSSRLGQAKGSTAGRYSSDERRTRDRQLRYSGLPSVHPYPHARYREDCSQGHSDPGKSRSLYCRWSDLRAIPDTTSSRHSSLVLDPPDTIRSPGLGRVPANTSVKDHCSPNKEAPMNCHPTFFG